MNNDRSSNSQSKCTTVLMIRGLIMGREGKENSERVCALKGKPADDVKNNLEEGREARNGNSNEKYK